MPRSGAMVIPTRDPLGHRFQGHFCGFGAAALARAHFGEEAWDTVIYDAKRIFATFTFIAFEATVHQILHTNCAQNSLDLHRKKDGNIYLEGCLLWLGLRN